MQNKKKVIILGAGPAGLTAAYELFKKHDNYEVTILEKEKQVGGISKTIKYHNNRMDLGGHRFFSKSEEINNLWEEILPTNTKNKEKRMLIRKRLSRIYYQEKFFPYPISLHFETLKKLGFKNTILCGFSYLKSILHKRKEESLEDFYINHFGKRLYTMFFKSYTEKLWGRNPREIAPDWGAQRVKGLSILTFLKEAFHLNKEKETSLIEEFKYPKYGPGELWEEMERQIIKMGGTIIKKQEVLKINVKKNIIVSVMTKNQEYKGDIFLSSLPLKDLVNGFTNKVPQKIKEIAFHLPYRDFITVGLLMEKKNFTKELKDCWIYVQEKRIPLGRIQIFNNWSPYLVKEEEKNLWIGLEYFCNEKEEFWNLSDKEITNIAIDNLKKMNLIKEREVLDSHVERVKKAYPAYFDSYKEIDILINYLNKMKNLYCIGRNGQHRYNNMDHSMLTAIEAVKVITQKQEKTSIWQVNTEKEYHEKSTK